MGLITGAVRKLALIAYVVVGLVVANTHHYLTHLNGARPWLSAVLAVAAWPLILLGTSVRIR